MRKQTKSLKKPQAGRPGDLLDPGFAGALTIAPPKKKPAPKARRAPLQVVGWKPKGKWLIRLRRGSGQSPTDRMIAKCDSLEDGRKKAEDYFKNGWDEAWVVEKL